MILSVAATQIEMQPFRDTLNEMRLTCPTLVTGVGPVETAVRLTRLLAGGDEQITGVMNFGVAGAYLQPLSSNTPNLLDICIAAREVAGDLGICLPEEIEYLDPALTGKLVYDMDEKYLTTMQQVMRKNKIKFHVGTFITVNAITGTKERGEMLRSKWNGLCENMEGAAVARVCLEFGVPCMELRCISNLVEDRNMANWRLQEACQKMGHAAACLIQGFLK